MLQSDGPCTATEGVENCVVCQFRCGLCVYVSLRCFSFLAFGTPKHNNTLFLRKNSVLCLARVVSRFPLETSRKAPGLAMVGGSCIASILPTVKVHVGVLSGGLGPFLDTFSYMSWSADAQPEHL